MPPKIVQSKAAPIESEQPKPAAQKPDKIEVTVTPKPKTRKERQDNAKAKRLAQAAKRQQENAYASPKPSKWQKKRQRKLERDIRHKAVQADLASGVISEEEAKKRLPRRQASRIAQSGF